MKRDPQVVMKAPALVPSDQNVSGGSSEKDIYLFALLSGLIPMSQDDLQRVICKNQPHYLTYVLPAAWIHPVDWNPLGHWY